jgi:hypothetical protein
MQEPILDRIYQLERSVQRWRLACLALAIVVVSLLAIGGTFGTMILLQQPNIREIEMLRMEAHAARDEAERAMHAERVARQEAERALQAERAVRQQMEGK